jgi:hypothetical protein
VVDYIYSKVAVYAELGGALRLARNTRSFATDPVTGVPVNVTQGAFTAPYLDTDSSGIADFTATTPGPIRLTTGATFVDVYSEQLPGDLLAASASATASAADAALSASLVGAPADTAVAAIVGNPASATSVELSSTYAHVRTVDVKSKGATGDGATDDTAAIQAAIAACAVGDILHFPPAVGYKATVALAVPAGINVLMDAPIISTVTTTTALTIGDVLTKTVTNKVRYRLSVENAVAPTWANAAHIGIVIANANTCKIEIVEASGFYIGVKCYGIGGGFSYNDVVLGNLQANKYQLVLACATKTASIGWVNENEFHGGRFWNPVSTVVGAARYGVRIYCEDGTYLLNDNNVFHKPSFELGTDGSETIPVLIEDGLANRFKDCRNENNGATFGRFLGTSAGNIVDIGWGYDPVFDDQSIYPGTNVGNACREDFKKRMNRKVYDSGHVRSKACYADASATPAVNIAGAWIGASTTATRFKYIASVTLNADSVNFGTGRALGITLSTDQCKKFLVRRDALTSGLVNVRCYDAAMALLYDAGIKYATGSVGLTLSPSTNFGGVYVNGAVTTSDVFFEVSSAVKFIDVMASVSDLRSMSIYTTDEGGCTAFNPLTTETGNIGTAAPTVGTWPVGQRIINSAPAAAGYSGWVCTVAGTPGTWKGYGLIQA